MSQGFGFSGFFFLDVQDRDWTGEIWGSHRPIGVDAVRLIFPYVLRIEKSTSRAI